MRRLFLIVGILFSISILANDVYTSRHWSVNDGLPQNTITAMLQDREGFMWFGTQDGVCRLDGYKFVTYRSDSRTNTNVTILHEDKDGQIWWQNYIGEFFSLDQERLQIIPRSEDEVPQAMQIKVKHRDDSVRIDPSGYVWLVDDKPGIRRYRDGRWKRFVPKQDPRWSGLSEKRMIMVTDQDGRQWMNPNGGGFGYYDAANDRFVTPLPIQCADCEAFVDKEGMLWLATNDRGVSCINFDHKEFQVHNLRERGNTIGETRALYLDGNKLAMVELDSRIVTSIVRTSKGLLYGSLKNGITYADGRKAPYETSSHEVYDMLAIGDTLCVATTDGLNIFLPTGERVIYGAGRIFRTIVLGKHHDIIAGGPRGLYRVYKDSTGIHSHEIACNDVHCIVATEDTCYVGTFGSGLYSLSLDDGQLVLTPIATHENIILSMALVGENLYMTDEEGITQYHLATGTQRYFAPLDREQNAFFTEGRSVVRPDSVIVLPYTHGYVEFDTRRAKPLGQTVPLHILDFRSAGTSYDVHRPIRLAYGLRGFFISYAAQEYSNPELIEYAYMLEGHDKDWHYVKDERNAIYDNLSPGTYTFRVRSTNRAREWVDNEQTLEIHIAQSIWVSWWMWIIYIILFTGLILTSVQISRKRERLHQEISRGEEINHAKLQFFTNISHELRTPLTLIAGPVDNMLRNDKLTPSTRQQLEIVQRNAARMLRMINQILDFRKIQNNKMTLKVELCRMSDIVGNAICNYAKEASDRHITLKVERMVENDTLWCDRQTMDTLVFNLLSNAFKYSHDGKAITVMIDERGDYLLLIVRDEGIGIAKEKIPHLFERYNSHSDSGLTVNRPGTGIGLNLVKEIVDLHHGFIEVDSVQGKGTTFTVVLRRDRDHYARGTEFIVNDMANVPTKPDTEEASIPAERKRDLIVVVDDNEDMRNFISTVLSRDYEIITAMDGVEALPIIRSEQPALVITDLMMPNMDGLQLTQHIKTGEQTSYIPTILLSAKSAIESRVEAMGIGADDYLTKPFEADYLKARVKNIIAQRRALEARFRERLLRMEPSSQSEQKRPEDEFLVRLHALMEKHMDDNSLNIDQLAEEIGLGRTIFFNKLKGLTGLSPVEFIREVRIKRAAQLLRDPNLNISEVTYMIGMNDSRYFSKCFKQAYGVTPTEYKRQHEEK